MSYPQMGEKRVAVVVVGDLGRSPRMQYHALALAALPRTKVDLIGFSGPFLQSIITFNHNLGSPCWPKVQLDPNINVVALEPPLPPSFLGKGILGKIYKVIAQVCHHSISILPQFRFSSCQF